MNSIKKSALLKIKKVLEGPEGPSQEELERNGIKVVIEFNSCCKHCLPDVKKRCKSMPGVSKVEDVAANYCEGKLALAVIGVFSIANLEKWVWNTSKHNKRITILKEEKIGGGAGGAAGGGASEAAGGGGGGAEEEEEEDKDEEEEEVD